MREERLFLPWDAACFLLFFYIYRFEWRQVTNQFYFKFYFCCQRNSSLTTEIELRNYVRRMFQIFEDI